MNPRENIKLLTWFNFFSDFKLYAPVAIIYFSQVSHSYTLGISIFSIAMIADAIFELSTGFYSDSIGRRNSIAVGALAATVAGIFYAIGQDYIFLVIGAVFSGLSGAFYSGNNNALLFDSLGDDKDKYHHFLGKTSAMFQLALGVAAILGGIIAHWSFALVMWLSVIPQILCLFISLRFVEPKIHSVRKNIYAHLKEAVQLFRSNVQLRRLTIADILRFGMSETSYQFQAAFYNLVWPLWAIGIAKFLSNMGASLSFHFSGKLIDKHKPVKWLIISNIYNRVANLISLIFPSIISPILMSSTSLFYGVNSVAKEALFQSEFVDTQRATMSSLNSLGGSIFFAVFSLSMGVIADKVGPATSLIIIQILGLSYLFIYLQVNKAYEQAKSTFTGRVE